MKLLVAVTASKLPEFQHIINEGQRATWANTHCRDPESNVVFYYGDSSTVITSNDEVYLPVPEGYENIIRKTTSFFAYALEHLNFDFLFRTNCSSYVDIPGLRKHLADKPRAHYFSGFLGYLEGRPYASGSGYILTPDLVELAVKHRSKVDFPQCPDDAVLSYLLQDLGATLRPARRQDFETTAQVSRIDRSVYHFRCKAYDHGRRVDDRLMRRVHELLHAE